MNSQQAADKIELIFFDRIVQFWRKGFRATLPTFAEYETTMDVIKFYKMMTSGPHTLTKKRVLFDKILHLSSNDRKLWKL